MLRSAFVFMIGTLLLAFAAFGGLLTTGAMAAKALFFVFLALFIFTLVSGSFLERPTA